MNLEDIILSKISQMGIYKTFMISVMWNIKQKSNKRTNRTNKNKLIDTDDRMVVTIGKEGLGRKANWVKEVIYLKKNR